MSVCLLLATCDKFATCGVPTLSVPLYPYVYLNADSYCWEANSYL